MLLQYAGEKDFVNTDGIKKISIEDIYEKTGLSRGTISGLYNDRTTRIDFETKPKLCELFECNMNSLLILKKEKSNYLGGYHEKGRIEVASA